MALAVISSQSHPPPAQPDEREDTEEPSMETLLDADDSTMRTTIDETEKVDDAAAYDFDGHPIDTTLLDEQIPINLPVATARKKFTLTTPVPPQSVSPSASLAAEFFREESLRVILRKQFVVYGPDAQADTVLIGFKLNFHPILKRRIVHCDLNMRFFVDAVGEFRKDIDILALQPEMFTDDDSLAEVEQSTSHSAGLVVGYEPWVQLEFQRTAEKTVKYKTAARQLVSGIATDTALMTVDENPSTQAGLPPSASFVVLLKLPEAKLAFKADMTMNVHSHSTRFGRLNRRQ